MVRVGPESKAPVGDFVLVAVAGVGCKVLAAAVVVAADCKSIVVLAAAAFAVAAAAAAAAACKDKQAQEPH